MGTAGGVAGTNSLDASNTIEMNKLDLGGTLVTSTAAELNILDTVTASATELNYLDLTTLGTGAASKAVVLDSGDDYTWPAAGVLTYGVLNDATTALAATCLEINRTCDVSGRLVAGGGTLALTQALHDGKTVLLSAATGTVLTLPAATGTGMRLRVVCSVTATSNTHQILCVGSDEYAGTVWQIDTDTSDAIAAYPAVAGDDFDTITLNGSTQGGLIGDWFEFEDMLSGFWSLRGEVQGTGTVATMLTKAA